MLRLIAITAALTVVVFSAPLPSEANAQGRQQAYTQEEQMACQDDAFRLCGNFIPNEQAVKACLVRNIRNLSPACRRMFQRGRKG